jgi:uncharacterized protein (TIGR02145 family)
MLKGIPRLGRAALFAVLLSFAVSGQNAPPPWINDEYRNNNYPQHKVGYAEGIVKKGEKGEKGETIEESRERLKLEAVKDLSMSIEARIIGSTSVDGKSHREGNVETITRDIQKMASSKTDTKLSGVEYSTYYEDARNKNKKWYVLAKVKTADLTARYSATADNSLLHAQHILKDMEDLYKRKMYNDVKTKSKERMAKALVECEWYVGLLGAVAPQSAEYKRLSDGFYSVRSGNDNILARLPTEKQIAVYTVGDLEETEKKILTDKMSAALKNLKDSPYQPIEDEKLQSRANKYKGGSVDSLQAELSNMASAQFVCEIKVILTTEERVRNVSAVISQLKDGKRIRKESGEATINSVDIKELQKAVDEITAQMGFRKSATPTTPKAAGATTFIDPRGNREYRTVTIGGKRWMAENLDYGARGSRCYDDKPENCAAFGRLYDWETAMKACPAGWHLATDKEWDELMVSVGGVETAGKKLKSTRYWNGSNGNGTDEYGFRALPGGYGFSDDNFGNLNNFGSWWSATEYDTIAARVRNMHYADEGGDWGIHYYRKTYLLSVRCVEGKRNGNITADELAKLMGWENDEKQAEEDSLARREKALNRMKELEREDAEEDSFELGEKVKGRIRARQKAREDSLAQRDEQIRKIEEMRREEAKKDSLERIKQLPKRESRNLWYKGWVKGGGRVFTALGGSVTAVGGLWSFIAWMAYDDIKNGEDYGRDLGEAKSNLDNATTTLYVGLGTLAVGVGLAIWNSYLDNVSSGIGMPTPTAPNPSAAPVLAVPHFAPPPLSRELDFGLPKSAGMRIMLSSDSVGKFDIGNKYDLRTVRCVED